jgi:hypothetical protein
LRAAAFACEEIEMTMRSIPLGTYVSRAETAIAVLCERSAAPTARFQLLIDGLTQARHVVRVSGRVVFSALDEIQIAVACEDPALAFDAIVGRAACLAMTLSYVDATSRRSPSAVSSRPTPARSGCRW